jgi:hypothetical protein
MSHRRIFFITTILLIVVFGSVTLVHFQTKNIDRFRPRVTEILIQITGHPVSLKKMNYAPLSGLFTLELLEMEVLAQDPAEPPMLQVPETLLSFSPISLFTGNPQLSAIKLINPQINLVLRDQAPLMERAQDTAMASDKKLLEELGFGLTELTIGRISVQNGILAILDWDHHEGRTWVFDHLQIGIHALSPTRASPLTASARYRSIPFTVNGQVGPLPESLDPFEMPILLSLEAKSIGLKDMQEILSTETINVKTSRGYLTTLLYGSMEKGLQISSWLQLDGIDLKRKDEDDENNRPPPKSETLLDRFSLRNEKSTLDLALRQKSTVRMELDGIPRLEFQEFFIYLDGSPIIETKGWIRGKWRGPLKLEMNILDSVNLNRFPWPASFPFKGNSPSGSFQLAGVWPITFTYSADLDLTQTLITLPPLEKKANTPLAINFQISQVRDQITIKEFLLHHTVIPDHIVKIDGSITPSLHLGTSISWNMENIADYFPIANNWNTHGMTRLNMEMNQNKSSKPENWQAKGEIQVERGKIGRFDFQDLRIPFEVEESQLLLPHIKMVSAGGRIEGLALADLSQDAIIFDSRITMVGTDITRLPGYPEGKDAVRLEGYLFAEAALQGQLDKQNFLPTEHLLGHAHLRVEPGRLAGIDQNALQRQTTSETIISDSKKSLYWNRMELDINLLNEKLTLNNILVDNSETQIVGHGLWEMGGNHWFELGILSDWDEQHGYKNRTTVNIEGDEITNGFRMKQKTPQ